MSYNKVIASPGKCNLVDPDLEQIDPTPSIHVLFRQFNKTFFWESLNMVEVSWSGGQMTSCAGLCSFSPRTGHCHIRLSAPLLSLRPRKDLVETLLHEMIHAYLFITRNNKDRGDHGPEFHKHMYRINQMAGTSISVYHTFNDEVRSLQGHVWRCDGPCQKRGPFYGIVRRAKNRAPGPNDRWWEVHRGNCFGTFQKIQEPPGYKDKRKKKDGIGKKGPKSSNGFILTPGLTSKTGSSSQKDNVGSSSSQDHMIPPRSKIGSNVHTFGTLRNEIGGSAVTSSPKPSQRPGASGQSHTPKVGNHTTFGGKLNGKTNTMLVNGKNMYPSETRQPKVVGSGNPVGTGSSRGPTAAAPALGTSTSFHQPSARDHVRNVWANRYNQGSLDRGDHAAIPTKLPAPQNDNNYGLFKKPKTLLDRDDHASITTKRPAPQNDNNYGLFKKPKTLLDRDDHAAITTKRPAPQNDNNYGLFKKPKTLHKPEDIMTECPVCDRFFPEQELQDHVNICLNDSFCEEFSEDLVRDECTGANASDSINQKPCPVCNRPVTNGRLEEHLSVCLDEGMIEESFGSQVPIDEAQKHPVYLESDLQDKSDNREVACPVCGVNVKEKFINRHIDECLNLTALGVGNWQANDKLD